MKTLNIPRIGGMALLHPAQVANTLKDNGVRAEIDTENWKEEYPTDTRAWFHAGHDGKALYILFCVDAKMVKAVNIANQSGVSNDSCVEAFIEPVPGGDYWNWEFNCIGAINASRRKDRYNSKRLTDEVQSAVRRWTSMGYEPFGERPADGIWTLLVAIPLDVMGMDATAGRTTARANFYACAAEASHPYYLSWAPIDTPHPDYHRPEFFGDIVLE